MTLNKIRVVSGLDVTTETRVILDAIKDGDMYMGDELVSLDGLVVVINPDTPTSSKVFVVHKGKVYKPTFVDKLELNPTDEYRVKSGTNMLELNKNDQARVVMTTIEKTPSFREGMNR